MNLDLLAKRLPLRGTHVVTVIARCPRAACGHTVRCRMAADDGGRLYARIKLIEADDDVFFDIPWLASAFASPAKDGLLPEHCSAHWLARGARIYGLIHEGCDAYLTVRELRAERTKRACGRACVEARTHVCRCACAGRAHGRAHQ